MLEVAEHYYHFDGVSPINAQNRQLIADLTAELRRAGIEMPVYWGNRNWSPYLIDALAEMRDQGVKRALALVTSAFSSYSGCRQYRENIEHARAELGDSAPRVDKLRLFFNHPGFIASMADRVRQAMQAEAFAGKPPEWVLYTAHSIPQAMAAVSHYEKQLLSACELVSRYAGARQWRLCYQSRSGPPSQPWLEPDIGDQLGALAAQGVRSVVVAPIGFLSDHLEVLYDLDVEAAEACRQLGITMVRAATVGGHPRLIRMFRELIEERLDEQVPRLSLGELGVSPDECRTECCLPPARAMLPAGRPVR